MPHNNQSDFPIKSFTKKQLEDYQKKGLVEITLTKEKGYIPLHELEKIQHLGGYWIDKHEEADPYIDEESDQIISGHTLTKHLNISLLDRYELKSKTPKIIIASGKQPLENLPVNEMLRNFIRELGSPNGLYFKSRELDEKEMQDLNKPRFLIVSADYIRH